MRLHIPAIPHTITSQLYSHYTFTGKALGFAPMMRSRGYQVYRYGVEGSEAQADVSINLLTKQEWQQLRIASRRQLHPEADAEAALADARQFVGILPTLPHPSTKSSTHASALPFCNATNPPTSCAYPSARHTATPSRACRSLPSRRASATPTPSYPSVSSRATP